MVIVGGGFAGAVAAMHLLEARPDLHVRVVERGGRVGRGLAYGACRPDDLLNVPTSRLAIGLQPGFQEWLESRAELRPELRNALDEAVHEAGGLADAFVPRELFGDYIEWMFARTVERHGASRLRHLRTEAVSFLDPPARGVALADGRRAEGDIVILALGNLPSRTPAPESSGLHDAARFIADPWERGALASIGAEDEIVVIGSGLTTVDIVLRLHDSGHRGRITAVSRHGLRPRAHAFGGAWAPFANTLLPASPLAMLQAIRSQVALAEAQGVPWQRVIDAVRPSIARIWSSWSAAERRVFLRHLRARWDVVRHRVAPRLARRIAALESDGRLRFMAFRGLAFDCGGDEIVVTGSADGKDVRILARWVINCTGPRTDYAAIGAPLIADARRRRLLQPDALSLGLESVDCAVVGADGATSGWLYAVGPMTRPAWWEITAAPEIVAQAQRLAQRLGGAAESSAVSLAETFNDMGAGI